jgi:hypothetical protein
LSAHAEQVDRGVEVPVALGDELEAEPAVQTVRGGEAR